MKETRFIAQNKEKWEEAESLLNSEVKDPEKLGNLFVQVVDDLSYSRTYYPNRSVRVYLNKIARHFFSIIYSHKKEKHNQFKVFWLDELPQLIIYSKKELIISLLVFVLAFLIGVFSAIHDPYFVNSILGDSYVKMTEANIAGGDPMAVYKQSHQMDMFLGITLNNLFVAFKTYVLGIFLGIGTLSSILFNGVMVGSFQYYFVQRGLFLTSASSIWLHGTLEISSLILAGGAGLVLGRGLIFPGTYSRLQSLQISGIRSLKLMLGIAPVFVLAAVIESFLTRYTDAPALLKILLIVLSAAFIIGYFVIYPWRKSKRGFAFPLKEVRLQASHTEPVNFRKVKNNAEILNDTIRFYFRASSSLMPWIFFISLGASLVFLFFDTVPEYQMQTNEWAELFSNMYFAMRTPSPLFIFTNALATSFLFYRVMKLIDCDFKGVPFTFDKRAIIQIFAVSLLIYGLIYLGPIGIFFIILSFGILVYIAFVQLTEESDLGHGIQRGWDLFWDNKSQGIGLHFTVLLLTISFLLMLSAPLIYIHMNVVRWNFSDTDEFSQKFLQWLEIFIKTISFYLALPLMVISLAYLYFSHEEMNTASALKESIARMGKRYSKGNKQ